MRAILQEHFVAGRLEWADLAARIAASDGARTRRDLERLVTDLPPIPGMALTSGEDHSAGKIRRGPSEADVERSLKIALYLFLPLVILVYGVALLGVTVSHWLTHATPAARLLALACLVTVIAGTVYLLMW